MQCKYNISEFGSNENIKNTCMLLRIRHCLQRHVVLIHLYQNPKASDRNKVVHTIVKSNGPVASTCQKHQKHDY